MEKTVTHHPFRTVELIYDRDKPQPDWETKALEKYLYMHDEVWRLKTMREDYEPLLDRVIVQLGELHGAVPSLEQQVGMLEAVVGLRGAVDGPRPEERESFRINLNGFRRACGKHSDSMNALYNEITRATEEHNSFLEEHEAFDAWFEKFADGPMHELYRRYDDVSVDTVSLDRDHQGFLEAWQPIIHAEREYFDNASNAFSDYADLVDITNRLYKRINSLDEALHHFTERNKQGKSGTINIRPRDEG